jgi:hypothetical protein
MADNISSPPAAPLAQVLLARVSEATTTRLHTTMILPHTGTLAQVLEATTTRRHTTTTLPRTATLVPAALAVSETPALASVVKMTTHTEALVALA